MDDLLCGQTRKVHLPFSYPFLSLVGDLFQIRFRRNGRDCSFRLVKQRKLLRKVLGPFAGCAKMLPLPEPELLGQPLHLPVQRLDLLFFFLQ